MKLLMRRCNVLAQFGKIACLLPLLLISMTQAKTLAVDKELEKTFVGHTYRGYVDLPINEKKEFAGRFGFFGQAFKWLKGERKLSESSVSNSSENMQMFKVEIRGTLADKLNPFRKKSYWRLYLFDKDGKRVDMTGKVEWKVDQTNVVISLYDYHVKDKVSGIFTVPVNSIINEKSISLSKPGITTLPGTIFELLKEVNLSENTKSLPRQLLLNISRKIEHLAQKQAREYVGLAAKTIREKADQLQKELSVVKQN